MPTSARAGFFLATANKSCRNAPVRLALRLSRGVDRLPVVCLPPFRRVPCWLCDQLAVFPATQIPSTRVQIVEGRRCTPIRQVPCWPTQVRLRHLAHAVRRPFGHLPFSSASADQPCLSIRIRSAWSLFVCHNAPWRSSAPDRSRSRALQCPARPATGPDDAPRINTTVTAAASCAHRPGSAAPSSKPRSMPPTGRARIGSPAVETPQVRPGRASAVLH